jgi:hypothetical protein
VLKQNAHRRAEEIEPQRVIGIFQRMLRPVMVVRENSSSAFGFKAAN